MNFLAHCVLADEAADVWQADERQRSALLAGAVIGDFVKGRIPSDWPQPVQIGVRLHRKIDAISNRNAAISQTCNRYSSDLRRYAPIFVDLLADHILALQWSDYRDDDLDEFGRRCAHALQTWWSYMPAAGQPFADYLIEENLLARYAHHHAVTNGLNSVIRRLRRRRAASIDQARVHTETLALVPGAAEDFATYYPQLRTEVIELAWI
jgi:acyl carrier protein phosphodiesterase